MPTATLATERLADAYAAQRRLAFARTLFSAAVALVLLVWGATLWAALNQPWLGLSLQVQGPAVVSSVLGGSVGPAQVTALRNGGGANLPVSPQDLIEEPDMLPDYAQWAAFYERQQAFAAALRSGPVQVDYETAVGTRSAMLTPAPSRPLTSLPPVFWFQLVVGAIGALVGSWVLALRPADGAARCLAVTGVALLGAASTAALYSTRELALPASLFTAASTLNHLSTIVFGIGLVGIFLFHPRRLAPPRVLAWLAAGWLAWGVADIAWWLPTPDVAMRLIIVTQMLGALGLGIAQWRLARGQPVDRAALRWVLLSFLVGCGSFVVLIVCTTMLGWLPPLSQGYGFGLFLLMYVGLALGVRRYRLFDLDRWSLRVLMWLFGLLGIVLVDAALLFLRVGEVLSLAASVLVCAALYFPLRQWAWEKLLRSRTPRFEDVASGVVGLALAPQASQRAAWEAFWVQLYQPLRVETEAPAAGPGEGALLEHGLGLRIAGTAGLPPLQLWQGRQGHSLFSSADLRLARRLSDLLAIVAHTRQAQEQGALQERKRIAADLHDDLGGKLLSIAQAGDAARAAILARQALDDLRLAVHGLVADAAPLDEVVADWRAESMGRAQAAGLQLHWAGDVPREEVVSPRVRIQATRMLREAVTNVIKHSAARELQIRIEAREGQLHLQVRDDGRGVAAAGAGGGQGLPGMRRRAQALGGQCHVGPGESGGTCVRIEVPLADGGMAAT